MNLHSSLQALKNELAKKEAALQTLYSLYPDLRGYSESQLLAYFELQTREALYHHIENIQKPLTPHLDTTDLQECSVCSCTDAKGESKDLYETGEDAEKAIEALRGRTKKTLTVYPCPGGFGWHLTKR